LPSIKKTYRQIAKDILTQICGGETTEEHAYTKGKTIYELANSPVIDVKAIEGQFKGTAKTLFAKDVDYRIAEDCIEWIGGGNVPDDNTVFTVQYVFTRSSGITDVNPGSVVRTVVEAISRELEYFYLQMEQAYLSGFLDTATGSALDLVVSILGIKRKPPKPASGYVTFGRNTEPEIIGVTGEVHLYDGSFEYTLERALVKDVIKIEGIHRGVNVIFENNVDFTLAGATVKWLREGNKPDAKTVFQVDYNAYLEVKIPKGTSVATLSLRPEETRLFNTTEEKILMPTEAGKWEAEVPVVCAVAGSSGNVLAGTVVVMPQPPSGVEYVINKGDVTNGVEAEEDDELRERAKHALEFAGKATYTSLESAIKSVEGVRALAIEDMPENVPGLVKVIVDGGDMDKIMRIIDDTRAAGIKVEVSRPEIVHIDVLLDLILQKDAVPAVVITETEKVVRSYISSLGIGADVIYSRIVELVMSLKGVWDVEDIFMTAHRIEGLIVENENENVEINSDEEAEPRRINISFVMRSK
jgi:uncharacterized phage protein gp47/JayE